MTSSTPDIRPPAVGARHSHASNTRVLVVLCIAAFMASLDLLVVNVAFPAIGADFAGTSLGALSWVLDAYAVVFAALLVPAGRIADRYGRRRALVLGLALFTGASAACAVSGGIWWLVGCRVAQAIGAAALTSASLGLVVATSAPDHRARSVEVWTAAGAVAAALGPTLGGLLVQASWRWIFVLNVPVGLLALLATLRWVPDSRDASITRLPDLLGAGLLAAGVGALSLGLVKAPDWGWSGARAGLTWAAAVACLAGFAAQSRRHPAPVVASELLRLRDFVRSNTTILLFAIPFAASLLAAVLWLQHVWGYSALRTGLAITPAPALVPVVAGIAHRVSSRVPIARLVPLGCLACGAGAVLLATRIGPRPAYVTEFLPAWLIMGVGVGLALPAVVSVATSALPPADAATGSGVVNMNRQIGTAIGVSLLVAVLGTPATSATFRHAWWTLAALAAVAAASAARLSTGDARRPATETDTHSAVRRAPART